MFFHFLLFVSLGEKIKVTINFGGTVTNPTLKTGLKDDGGKSTTEAVKDQVVTAVADKANEEAQKILDDAKKESDILKEAAKKEGYQIGLVSLGWVVEEALYGHGVVINRPGLKPVLFHVRFAWLHRLELKRLQELAAPPIPD